MQAVGLAQEQQARLEPRSTSNRPCTGTYPAGSGHVEGPIACPILFAGPPRRFNEQPVLPFNAFGTMAMARSEFETNDASSQFFFLLKVGTGWSEHLFFRALLYSLFLALEG